MINSIVQTANSLSFIALLIITSDILKELKSILKFLEENRSKKKENNE